MKLDWKAIVPVAIGLAIWLVPTPQGLQPYAWQYFALFTAVIAALVLEPIPAAAAGLMGITLAAALNLVPAQAGVAPTTADALRWALSGFSNGTVWLIFVAFMFAMGYEKTGLGRRISLVLIKKLGRSTLGLGYAVALADLALAPFTPSNTARSGGVIFPIIKNIPPLYGSTPESGARKIGGYLMWTALSATCVTSTMFLTALAPNLLALSLLEKTAKFTFTWNEWFLSLAPACIILFAALPYLVYVIYPPEIKRSDDAPRWAGEELAKMGALTRKEITMAGLAVFALVLWIFGGKLFDATTVALMALSLMILTGVVTWEDITGHKTAWNVLCWFATLVALADGLGKVGFLKWFAALAAGAMSGFSISALMLALVLLFFFIHYMFASLTAHTTALLPVILATAMGIPGIPMKTFAILICATLGLMGILTPYATGPSPVYYGCGYITRKEFWTLGFVFGVIFIGVLLGVNFPYLLMRGAS
ncbi:Citrate carrier [Fundidesulfovibrio magnetotacticus]|uniref:Citrate carrier n=1 Tax=Fundidesulfovibrio magnetotacticus TaxID=2730080 RepID=A0A6V8LSX8_9BACT|nr:anion permease [Fundidesulfovibrio magnetotacticus]GFK93418.1 Citrate carrier [Fundidesulfovibrio magnetotacticus]